MVKFDLKHGQITGLVTFKAGIEWGQVYVWPGQKKEVLDAFDILDMVSMIMDLI